MSEMIIGEDLHEKKVRLGLSSQVVLRLRFWSQIGYDVAEAEELSRRIYDYYSAGRMESQSRPDILGIELDILQSFFFRDSWSVRKHFDPVTKEQSQEILSH